MCASEEQEGTDFVAGLEFPVGIKFEAGFENYLESHASL